MRRDASAPNSPRDSGVGVVMPRAMKPDWVSKSKVRQTMWRGMAVLRGLPRTSAGIDYNIAHGHAHHRHHPQRRDRAHLLTQHLANALAPIRDEGGLPPATTASCRG